MSDYRYVFKTIVVGNAGVGKTALLFRLTEQRFVTDYDMTIGVEFAQARFSVPHPAHDMLLPVKMQMWDCAGTERFRSICTSYFRGAHAAVFVYDVSHRPSFTALAQWLKLVSAHTRDDAVAAAANDTADTKTCHPPPVSWPVFLIIANKSDLHDMHRRVSQQEGEQFARDHHCLYAECSAKTGHGVQDAFRSVAETIVAHHLHRLTDTSAFQLHTEEGCDTGQSSGLTCPASSCCAIM